MTNKQTNKHYTSPWIPCRPTQSYSGSSKQVEPVPFSDKTNRHLNVIQRERFANQDLFFIHKVYLHTHMYKKNTKKGINTVQ